MSKECDIVRDLLPLYVDDVLSGTSREIIEEHLPDCPGCRDYLKKLRDSELENDLKREKNAVIEYGARKFKPRSAAVGSAFSGILMIPLVVILTSVVAPVVGWYYVVIAALCVVASLIVVPLIIPEDKLFWTFCAFCASLMVLLGVTCLYTHGDWFGTAASATLFGLSVIGLPFMVRARPVKRLIAGRNAALIVVGVDVALFLNMLYMIGTHGRITLNSILFTLGIFVGVGLVVLEIARRKK